MRQGDVAPFTAEVRDGSRNLIDTAAVSWSVVPQTGGLISSDGSFVAYAPGSVSVVASADSSADTAVVVVSARGLAGSFTVVGSAAPASRFTSDLWVHGTVAYTGSWGARTDGGSLVWGNTLFVWDIRDSANPTLSDSVLVDAATVNDVKVRADGVLAVITHEGSRDSQNGITLLDLSDQLQPMVISRFTDGLESGVHNVWVQGDYVYAVADSLRVIDISDPQSPQLAASYLGGPSFLHDVYVRNGLAFLSHWNDGLIILDVGSGVAGGSPQAPVEIGRVAMGSGQTHNAWYWPQAGYVFVGEEDFQTPGIMHVLDVSDLSKPMEVAWFEVSGSSPPHNFWLDEVNGVLYAAWYSEGLRAVDVTGRLLGSLDRQGREIASLKYGGAGSCPGDQSSATCTWAPQLHNGLIYLSDMNTGLWVVRLED